MCKLPTRPEIYARIDFLALTGTDAHHHPGYRCRHRLNPRPDRVHRLPDTTSQGRKQLRVNR